MQERVRTTITTMTQYGVTAYIVVNEAGSGNDIFWNKIGPDYIEIAFQTARDTSKGLGLPLTLIYNDYDNNTSKQKRTAWTLKMVEDLKQKDLIDAVGLETIIDYPDDPSIDGMAETMQSYKIPVIISESAVNMKNFYGSQPEREKKQAQIYNNLVSAALQSGVCKDFIVFEPIDELTPWEIEPTLDGYSKNSDPSIYHLVDGKIQPKLSYFSIKKGMVDWLIGSTNQ
jgi:GH35 family endo-1,4-beta-xylanase